MNLNKLSVAVASSTNENNILCASCKKHLAWVNVIGDQRIVCIPKLYHLSVDGVWQAPNPRLPHQGKARPIRKPATSPVRVGCRHCGSVQFVFPENFDAGILDQTIEEARAWTP